MTHYYSPSRGLVLAPSDLAAAFPETSIPSVSPMDADSMQALGIAPLLDALVPSAAPGCTPVRGPIVELGDGSYRQTWTQVPWDADQAAAQVRIQRAYLLGAATAMRWEKETGGIVLPGGVRIATAKADQDRITSVLVNAAAAGVESVDFKAETGWTTLSIDQVRGIASAVARHVQACFTAERRHHEAIASVADAGLASYDVTQGWPA